MIVFEKVRKEYPGGTLAVQDFSLEIASHESVVLVGSSGSGKTTLMRMVNRMVEPTAGRILIDGDDVAALDPVQLRRSIGYVMQASGLLPHRTVLDNITTVPVLRGTAKREARERAHELMETVGLDPALASRYPSQLSGGQQQRVGVARALGGDPQVMLMDEPFGAIDPITRERLQNEFLRLQSQVRKTIVFVTHDIDEAIKMGDRIAILQEGSTIAQYDTPERILTAPANDFVRDFIGGGASLKRLSLSRVRDIELGSWPTVRAGESGEHARQVLHGSRHSAVLVLDDAGRPARWVGADDLRQDPGRSLDEIGAAPQAVVEPHATLSDALNELITARHAVTVVVDEAGRYQGVVDIDQINEAIRTMRRSAVAEARTDVSGTEARP